MLIFAIGVRGSDTRVGVMGHAEYDEPGRDIVCAAASMMIQQLAGAMMEEDGVECEWKGESGHSLVTVRPSSPEGYGKGTRERVSAMLDMTVTGFRMLEQAYPEYVRIAGAEE